MLTAKQHELLTFIDGKIRQTGVSPSFDEMKEALGLRSKSGIHRLITALEERGFLRRLRHRARALEVVKMPENAASPRSVGGFQPNVVEGGRGARPAPESRPVSFATEEMREVQLLNTRIAAGIVKETVEAQSETIHVPGFLVPALGEHYALKVDGDSMTGLGINDGDTIIVQRTDSAATNDVVVAYIHDEGKATLKTLRMRGEMIALEAANPKYETQIFRPGQVSVQGRLVALMRAY